MTDPDATAARRALDAALADPARLDAAPLTALAPATLDDTLRAFADAHGAAALPVLDALAAPRLDRGLRRAARLAAYRLAQRGVSAPARPAARPVVERRSEAAARAWLSGIDGSGSRAVWVLFDGALGGLALCSLIVNDEVGILDAAGGEISKKRLETELAGLRASQKLPWLEVEASRALAVVGDALTLHRARGTSPPAAFARWDRLFVPTAPAPLPPLTADPAQLEQSASLLELPELARLVPRSGVGPERRGGSAAGAREQARRVRSDQERARGRDRHPRRRARADARRAHALGPAPGRDGVRLPRDGAAGARVRRRGGGRRAGRRGSGR